jgi:PhoD related phosphatase
MTFTSDSPSTQQGEAPDQTSSGWTLKETADDPSYIVGKSPGPYIEERSRSIFCKLGARISFLGVDARTERTRHQINYPDTYRLIFERLQYEHSRDRELKHLVVLLGIPIAYPRLQWLENFFDSPLIAPIRFLNRRFGVAGGVFNKFDGQVDLLDDLDDHYATKHHKAERRELIQRLQDFSKEHAVRVTILGGDVHLATIGRFYSRPEEGIVAERDWRYMVNVISSAITNKPPPAAIANLIARRDKVHRLDEQTHERMLDFFDRNPGRGEAAVEQHRAAPSRFKLPGRKTAARNHITMPSRNYAILCESGPRHGRLPSGENSSASAQGISSNASIATAATPTTQVPPLTLEKGSNTRQPMHEGERRCGTKHPAADGVTPTGLGGPCGLDVTLRVEIDASDPFGTTEGYGLTIPGLVGGKVDH